MEGAMVVDIMQRGVRDAYRDGELSVRGLSGRSGASPLEMSSSAHSQQQLHQQQQRHKDSAVDRHAGSDADDDGDEEAQPDDDAAAGAEDACTLAELQTVYHLPSKDAARQLNISLSRLKRSCRVYRVMRWPHRKLSSLRNLRETITNDRNMRPPDKERVLEQIEQEIKAVINNPDHNIDKRLDDIRQAKYKLKYYHKTKHIHKAAAAAARRRRHVPGPGPERRGSGSGDSASGECHGSGAATAVKSECTASVGPLELGTGPVGGLRLSNGRRLTDASSGMRSEHTSTGGAAVDGSSPPMSLPASLGIGGHVVTTTTGGVVEVAPPRADAHGAYLQHRRSYGGGAAAAAAPGANGLPARSSSHMVMSVNGGGAGDAAGFTSPLTTGVAAAAAAGARAVSPPRNAAGGLALGHFAGTSGTWLPFGPSHCGSSSSSVAPMSVGDLRAGSVPAFGAAGGLMGVPRCESATAVVGMDVGPPHMASPTAPGRQQQQLQQQMQQRAAQQAQQQQQMQMQGRQRQEAWADGQAAKRPSYGIMDESSGGASAAPNHVHSLPPGNSPGAVAGMCVADACGQWPHAADNSAHRPSAGSSGGAGEGSPVAAPFSHGVVLTEGCASRRISSTGGVVDAPAEAPYAPCPNGPFANAAGLASGIVGGGVNGGMEEPMPPGGGSERAGHRGSWGTGAPSTLTRMGSAPIGTGPTMSGPPSSAGGWCPGGPGNATPTAPGGPGSGPNSSNWLDGPNCHHSHHHHHHHFGLSAPGDVVSDAPPPLGPTAFGRSRIHSVDGSMLGGSSASAATAYPGSHHHHPPPHAHHHLYHHHSHHHHHPGALHHRRSAADGYSLPSLASAPHSSWSLLPSPPAATAFAGGPSARSSVGGTSMVGMAALQGPTSGAMQWDGQQQHPLHPQLKVEPLRMPQQESPTAAVGSLPHGPFGRPSVQQQQAFGMDVDLQQQQHMQAHEQGAALAQQELQQRHQQQLQAQQMQHQMHVKAEMEEQQAFMQQRNQAAAMLRQQHQQQMQQMQQREAEHSAFWHAQHHHQQMHQQQQQPLPGAPNGVAPQYPAAAGGVASPQGPSAMRQSPFGPAAQQPYGHAGSDGFAEQQRLQQHQRQQEHYQAALSQQQLQAQRELHHQASKQMQQQVQEQQQQQQQQQAQQTHQQPQQQYAVQQPHGQVPLPGMGHLATVPEGTTEMQAQAQALPRRVSYVGTPEHHAPQLQQQPASAFGQGAGAAPDVVLPASVSTADASRPPTPFGAPSPQQQLPGAGSFGGSAPGVGTNMAGGPPAASAHMGQPAAIAPPVPGVHAGGPPQQPAQPHGSSPTFPVLSSASGSGGGAAPMPLLHNAGSGPDGAASAPMSAATPSTTTANNNNAATPSGTTVGDQVASAYGSVTDNSAAATVDPMASANGNLLGSISMMGTGSMALESFGNMVVGEGMVMAGGSTAPPGDAGATTSLDWIIHEMLS